jgi:hypothetical protein
MQTQKGNWLTLDQLMRWVPKQQGHAKDDFALIVEGATGEKARYDFAVGARKSK